MSALIEAPDGCTLDGLMDLRLIYHHVAAARHQQHQWELLLQAVSWHSLASLNLSHSGLACSVDHGTISATGHPCPVLLCPLGSATTPGYGDTELL